MHTTALKLKLLAATMLLSLTAFSQTGINKDTCYITLSCNTARKVAADLIRGDSAKSQLKLTSYLLASIQSKSQSQDSVIRAYAVKTVDYKHIIHNADIKEIQYKETISGLETDNIKLQKKLYKTYKLGGVGMLALAALAIIGFATH